jgi:hypothetical protein
VVLHPAPWNIEPGGVAGRDAASRPVAADSAPTGAAKGEKDWHRARFAFAGTVLARPRCSRTISGWQRFAVRALMPGAARQGWSRHNARPDSMDTEMAHPHSA